MRPRRELMHGLHADLVDHDGKQAVVGPYVEAAAGLDDQPPPRAADSWVDNRQVHRAAGEMAGPRQKEERTRGNPATQHLRASALPDRCSATREHQRPPSPRDVTNRPPNLP